MPTIISSVINRKMNKREKLWKLLADQEVIALRLKIGENKFKQRFFSIFGEPLENFEKKKEVKKMEVEYVDDIDTRIDWEKLREEDIEGFEF